MNADEEMVGRLRQLVIDLWPEYFSDHLADIRTVVIGASVDFIENDDQKVLHFFHGSEAEALGVATVMERDFLDGITDVEVEEE